MSTTSYYDTIADRSVGSTAAGIMTVGGQTYSYPSWSPSYVPTTSSRAYANVRDSVVSYDPSKGRRFKKAKESGEILMSPLTREKETITQGVMSVNCRRSDAAYWRFVNGSNVGAIKLPCYSSWSERYDLSYLTWLGVPQLGAYYQGLDDEVQEAIVSTQQSAWSDALSAYDLLSEIGEAKETLSFFTDKLRSGADLLQKFKDKDPQTYRKYRKSTPFKLSRLADKAAQRLGKRWMEYRYALMPIIYSINDVSKVLRGRSARYQTDRSHVMIDVETPLLGSDSSLYLSHRTTGSVRVNSTTKARYDLGSLQRLAATCGMNPIKTAWELTSLSFVADWFLNIGDAIQALTGVDLASERQGCTSVRASVIDQTYATMNRSGVVNRVWRDGNGNILDSHNAPYLDQSSQIVYERKLEAYRRTLWLRPSAALQFSPFLNWKRYIDGAVLSLSPTKRILRSL